MYWKIYGSISSKNDLTNFHIYATGRTKKEATENAISFFEQHIPSATITSVVRTSKSEYMKGE